MWFLRRMARMELDCNLKSLRYIFQVVFPCLWKIDNKIAMVRSPFNNSLYIFFLGTNLSVILAELWPDITKSSWYSLSKKTLFTPRIHMLQKPEIRTGLSYTCWNTKQDNKATISVGWRLVKAFSNTSSVMISSWLLISQATLPFNCTALLPST